MRFLVPRDLPSRAERGPSFLVLATQLSAGALLLCSRDTEPDVFAATQVGLGALGVIGTVTLQCEPAYALAAAEAPAPLDAVLTGLEELAATNDHLEFY